ncbi:MAG: UDP-glucose 4-epimerase GalE [Desulfobacteraceae bacterium]|nr:UDP-glucose 4-epimerase GalE [Desulfobacteraceae bacterium]
MLITGGAGYVGSHTCKAVSEAGYLPVTYDNLSRGHDWSVKWGPLEVGDIRDKDRLDEVIRTYHPIAVMHFAAFAYVGESTEKPGLYYDNNVSGSINLIETVRRHDIRYFIFSSSCATYGDPEQIPITENHPLRPINPYGESKLMVERILRDYHAAGQFHTAVLRYFNAAGADPQLETGECHDPETHLIPTILKVATGENAALEIHGDDYDTGDGTCIRDFVHVTDLASGHVKALDYIRDRKDAITVNLGTGNGYTVNEVVRMSESISNRPVARSIGNRRPGDAPVLVASADRAKQMLNWEPKFSDLNTIISTAWRWEQRLKPYRNSADDD